MTPGFKTRSDEWGVVMRETTRSTGFGMGASSSFFAGLAEFSRGWRSIGWSAGFDTTLSSLYHF